MSKQNSVQFGGDHYRKQAIQVWDYIASNNIPYLEGNIVKYVSRWRDKGGINDLLKARHYIDKLIELEEAAEVFPREADLPEIPPNPEDVPTPVPPL